jgi:tetratricopeptide (TPR) repeat protein
VARENFGRAWVQVGKYDQAIEEFRKAIALSGGHPRSLGLLGYAYAVTNRRDEALKVVEELKETARHKRVSSYLMAMVYAGLEEQDEAIEWLERAHENRDSPWLNYYLKADPWADCLRSHPGFKQLLDRMGLA